MALSESHKITFDALRDNEVVVSKPKASKID